MKFALFLLGSWTEPEVGVHSRIFDEMVEQAEYAEELGFDSVWIAEHHSSRYGICPSLMPLPTHIAGRTRKIRIGDGVNVLPFHNPIFLADAGTLHERAGVSRRREEHRAWADCAGVLGRGCAEECRGERAGVFQAGDGVREFTVATLVKFVTAVDTLETNRL